ncbi:MAG TPA: ThuA domain-containing protein [Verrucomicrobiota bacterium]|nr:ThuA domain-containing protein [Verrucomicrobiota bacterium]
MIRSKKAPLFYRLTLLPLILTWLGAPGWAQDAFKVPPFPPADAIETERVRKAIPTQALARPLKPRRLLIFDLNVGYGGHGSISYANQAFTWMGEQTGAFAATVSRDPEVFRQPNLRQYDAVFLNNTVGNLFTNAELRQNLVEFVYSGGGLLGMHGTSVAFTRWPGAIEDWPEFGIMLGGRGANHRESQEHVFMKLDDPTHPLVQAFQHSGFDYRDEFFRVHEPFSRSRVRVLLSMDTNKTDLNQGRSFGQILRPDNDYAMAWIRNYGRGRVFYCTFAHNPYVFSDPVLLRFHLAALQFTLGDLPAPTTPSDRLTPAIRAQEKLGLRLGVSPPSTGQATVFEAIEAAQAQGLLYLDAADSQIVSSEIRVPFTSRLNAGERSQIRLKLDASGVRLLAYRVTQWPSDPDEARRLFGFARLMGAEVIMGSPPPSALGLCEALGKEHEMKLAISFPQKQGPRQYRRLNSLIRLCKDRPHVGVAGHLGHWRETGIDPREAMASLKSHLFTCNLSENYPIASAKRTHEPSPTESIPPFLTELSHRQLRPILLTVTSPVISPSQTSVTTPELLQFNQLIVKLASP